MQKMTLTTALAAVCLVACGKADISDSCDINGFGMGKCMFTNRGTRAGAICGFVEIGRNGGVDGHIRSDVFCSGEVQPKSSVEVNVSVPGVRTLCDPETGKNPKPWARWDQVCTLSFREEKAAK